METVGRWVRAVLAWFVARPLRRDPYDLAAPYLHRTPEGALYGRWGGGDAVLVWLHGRGLGVGASAAFYERVAADLGVTIVAPEYAGYGPDARPPSLDRTVADCRAVYRHAAAGTSQGHITLVGVSLGAGIALELHRDPAVAPARLLLVAPFLSVLAVGLQHVLDLGPGGSPAWLRMAAPFDVLRSWESARVVRADTLIVHGTADRLIHPAQGARLARELPREYRRGLVSVEGATHADIKARWPEWREAVRAFLRD